MENDILDAIEQDENDQIKIKSWVSIILLWIGIALSVNNGLITSINTIIAIGILIVMTVVNFVNWKLGVKITLLGIILGTFNIVNYYPITYFIGISIGWLSLGIELILLAIGIIHFITNKEKLKPYLNKIIKSSDEEKLIMSRSSINGFKRRFAHKSKEELERIIELNRLVPDAIKASKELLEEKENKTRS